MTMDFSGDTMNEPIPKTCDLCDEKPAYRYAGADVLKYGSPEFLCRTHFNRKLKTRAKTSLLCDWKAIVVSEILEVGELKTKYYTIRGPHPSPSGKTSVWSVDDDYGSLGSIRWTSAWRRYVFMPAAHTFYDAKCMRMLADFCETKTREHMAKKKMSK